jgi:hypothetical protein
MSSKPGEIVVTRPESPEPGRYAAAALVWHFEPGADWNVITGAELAAWTGHASVLTDDHAPVDQLLAPYSGR